jgi:peptidoglycan/LPS O-acetylase OafA/YrhL
MHDESIRRVLAQVSRPWPLPALAVFLFCMLAQTEPIAEAFSLAALLVSTTLHPDTACARAVSFKPLAWLGRISYSVYLWQGFFFAQHRVWALCVTPVFALASYYCIEGPFTRLGHRLTRENDVPTNNALLTPAGTIAE